MSETTRRKFLATVPTGVTLAALNPKNLSVNPSQEASMTQTLPAASVASHGLKPLPFNPATVVCLSAMLIRSASENYYGGSVKTINTVKQRLVGFPGDANTPPFLYNDLKRTSAAHRFGGIAELYFGNLKGTRNQILP